MSWFWVHVGRLHLLCLLHVLVRSSSSSSASRSTCSQAKHKQAWPDLPRPREPADRKLPPFPSARACMLLSYVVLELVCCFSPQKPKACNFLFIHYLEDAGQISILYSDEQIKCHGITNKLLNSNKHTARRIRMCTTTKRPYRGSSPPCDRGRVCRWRPPGHPHKLSLPIMHGPLPPAPASAAHPAFASGVVSQ